MTRKSDTQVLAQWFRESIQGQPFHFNDPTCRMLLRQAKDLVNPGKGGKTYSLADIQAAVQHAVREIRRRDPSFKPNNIQVISWQGKSGQTFFEEATAIPPAPPIYERLALEEWLAKYGERAIGKEKTSELQGRHRPHR